jgi:hypothetical protein
MTVSELLKLLVSLGQVLEASGAKSVATELQEVALKMQPFGEYKLKAFAEFLQKAAEAPRAAPGPKGSAHPVVDGAQQIQTALDTVRRLYHRALEPEITVDFIQAEVGRFAGLSKPQLDELAKQFEISRKLKTKGDVLKAIAQRIIDRKGARDRSQV